MEYSTTTDNLGSYTFDDIYYGEASTVTVSCSYLDHDIVSHVSVNADTPTNKVYVDLDVNTHIFPNASFFDKTAYAITGNVRHMDIDDCYLEGITVTRIYSIDQNGTRVRPKEEKESDVDGNYTFIVNPEIAGLDSIIIVANNVQYLNEVNGQAQDSICYAFQSNSDNGVVQSHADGSAYITNFNLDKTTVIDFHDETLYTVTVNVTDPW